MQEHELETFLEEYPEIIEEGLEIVERQKRTEFGIIDLLAKDKNQKYVIIEVKIRPNTNVIAQLAKYVIALEKEGILKESIRAVLVAKEIDSKTQELCEFFNIETRGLSLSQYKQQIKSTEVLTIASWRRESSHQDDLSDREITILKTIHELNQQGQIADYPTIAEKLGLATSTIRDFVNSMTNRNVPIIKKKMLPNGLKFKLAPELVEKLNKVEMDF